MSKYTAYNYIRKSDNRIIEYIVCLFMDTHYNAENNYIIMQEGPTWSYITNTVELSGLDEEHKSKL